MRKKTLRIVSLLGLVVIVSVIYVITSRFALPRQAASPAASPTAYPTTDATVTPIQPAVVQAAQIQSIPTQIPQSASSTLALTPDSPPTLRPKNTPTRAPTRTPRNTPTATIRCQKATPIVTAASLDSVNLSPSGQWAAYWVSTPEDFARMQGYRPPAALYFTNLQTGQTCPRPELTRLDEYPPVEGACPMNYGPVQLSDDESTVIVITEQGFFTGQPCQTKPFKQEANYVVPDEPGNNTEMVRDDAFSPDGQYRFGSTYGPLIDGIATTTSTITSTLNGQIALQAIFQVQERIGGYGVLGQWLNNQQYLIEESVDQGPLILDIKQGVISVATGIFGLKQVPRESIDEYGLYATALPDFSTQTYHLILAAFGTEDKFPDIQLYHSENGLIEKLPFQETWLSGFSQDGLWLLMYSYPDSGGYSILLRRVEKPDDGWHLLASDISYPNWNTNWSQVAYGHTRNNQIIWQTFPEGENLGCWDTDPYNTSQIIFSPDGCTLLTLGNRPGERGDGLFALNRCLPSPTPTLPPPQTQDFTMLADAKAAARFTILAPAFVPEGLFLDKVTVMDYEDGSQTVQITYAEDYTGEILDANRKFVFVWLTSGGSPVTLDSLKSTFKEVAWDILPVTVRGQAGFSYWMPANAAGNSAWLAWNEGDLTISIAMYGDWPQPTEADPHGLDGILFNIAKSLK